VTNSRPSANTVAKHGRRLELPVSITVVENLDLGLRWVAWLWAVGIVSHLDHPQPTVFIKLCGNRILNLRLRSDQLDSQPLIAELKAAY
jgi:hypothetical protein